MEKNTCEIDWKHIYENNPDEQNEIAIEIKRRQFLRKSRLDKAGLPVHNMAPMLQWPVEQK